MSAPGSYKVRPAGRHLLTIGRDLIQDTYAAVLELVKNAYDADSPSVVIEFTTKSDGSGYIVRISDSGHGMTLDTVVNKWMVPSTRDKLDRRTSPGGRVLQGRKGVGRYAASVLGEDLLLETVDESGQKTTLYVVWSAFESAEYLDDVEILIETSVVTEKSGTTLTINGSAAFTKQWDKKQFDKLRFELKKLMSPIRHEYAGGTVDSFSIQLKIHGFTVSVRASTSCDERGRALYARADAVR